MDIKLDPTTHDLVKEGFGFVLTSDESEALAQRVKVKLLLFKEEWFMDLNSGVPYHQEIFTGDLSKNQIDLIFKEQISTTLGLKSLDSYSSTFDGSTRLFNISFKGTTDKGSSVSVSLAI